MIFIQFNVYFTFIIVTPGNDSSGNRLLYWKSSDFLLHCTIMSWNIFSSVMVASGPLFLFSPLQSWARCPFMSLLTAKFSLQSSVIAGLRLGFLRAVSFHMPRLVTGITVAQGAKCVLTIHEEYSWPCWSRVSSCIDDRSISYWSCDCIDLHPDLSCVFQVVLFSWLACLLQSSHVWVWIARE